MRALVAWVVCAAAVGGPLVAQEAVRPAIRTIAIAGTPYERGVAHGEQLRAEIAALLAAWDGELRRDAQLGRDAFVEQFLRETAFEPAARRWTPELLDEVRGIAAGAQQDYATMLAWQLVDEMWVYLGDLRREKCTTIGVDRRGDQPTIVAQNLDVPRWYHGHQCVLRIRDESRDLDSLVVTIPGLVGAAGLNRAGIAVGVNTVMQLRPCRDGLPVAFVVRGLLMQKDHAAALRFLREVVHASGQSYTVGGPETAPGFECSAGKVVPFRPYEGAAFTFHTNHPLANDDFAPWWRERAQRLGKPPFALASCPRLETCKALLPATAAPDLAQVEAVLASRDGRPSVCNDSTYCCLVMLLGAEPELRIAAGGGERFEFEVLGFAR